MELNKIEEKYGNLTREHKDMKAVGSVCRKGTSARLAFRCCNGPLPWITPALNYFILVVQLTALAGMRR
jgi:hypothetical protein